MKSVRVVTHADGSVEFPEFPRAQFCELPREDAVAALHSLAMHEFDLAYCERALMQCLPLTTTRTADSRLQLKMWWTATLALYVKCFRSDGARQGLDDKLFPTASLEKKHAYYVQLRNRHLIHDVNAFAQCLVGAVITSDESGSTIHDVVSVVYELEPDAGDVQNVLALVVAARNFVLTRARIFRAMLKLSLEAKSHDELRALEQLRFEEPSATDVDRSRGRPGAAEPRWKRRVESGKKKR